MGVMYSWGMKYSKCVAKEGFCNCTGHYILWTYVLDIVGLKTCVKKKQECMILVQTQIDEFSASFDF